MVVCQRCRDFGWICEQHCDRPFPHANPDERHGQCLGPGMPCGCSAGVRLARRLEAKYRVEPLHRPAGNEAAPHELVASYAHTLDTLERSIIVVRALVDAYEAGERPSDQTLHDYRGQCARVDQQVNELRAMLASFKSDVEHI
jgi:hypothetical protein